jgi:hypothetical protein
VGSGDGETVRTLAEIRESAAANLVLLVVVLVLLYTMQLFASCGHDRLPAVEGDAAIPHAWTNPSWPVPVP